MEVGVDVDRGRRVAVEPVEGDARGVQPQGPLGAQVDRLGAPAQHQQVGHHLGTGHPSERSGGQAQCPDEFPALGDVASGGLRGGVHGVAAGQHCDVAARCRQCQRLVDEVVVNAVPGRVVRGIVHDEPAERHVADGGHEAVLGHPRGLEALVADLRRGVQRRGDGRGDRIVLHADHHRGLRGMADEVATATARLQYPTSAETCLAQRLPDGGDDSRIGVVRVEDGRLGVTVLVAGQ